MAIYNHSYDLFCSNLKAKGAKILDVGCGPGNITRYLLSKKTDFDILGIDVSPNMIERAKSNNPAADFIVEDCRNISSLKTKFDGVICGFCLPYLSIHECSELIGFCYELLLAGGIIIFLLWKAVLKIRVSRHYLI
ncbi:class I SAM-dependent methyltransferase [Sphingobacterium sp.]|uniref:class I SAM-dependent methyltransferase n=1 Tax=Sphingobacterium sp. TaxID=341027 RepID=UPI00258868D8|nr:class I SAM-dependent methyltransferase [Sphingobacterium sp.]WET67801.1 MAG: class I SAM-dependent methyltransferase [Sphingobacterium sp.]